MFVKHFFGCPLGLCFGWDCEHGSGVLGYEYVGVWGMFFVVVSVAGVYYGVLVGEFLWVPVEVAC